MLEDKVRNLAEEVKEELLRHVNDEDFKKRLYKKDGDITWKVDLFANDILVKKFKENDIPCYILSEEQPGIRIAEEPEYIAIIDPIDGTYNFVSNIPFASISIAISKYKEKAYLSDIFYSIVINLFQDEIFEAKKGKGSYLNGYKICVNNYRSDDLTGVIYTNDPISIRELVKKFKRIRVLGSASLEVCYIACNRLDFFIDNRNHLRNVDIAAAYLILREAGGALIDINGNLLNCGINDIEKISIICSKDIEMCKFLLNYVRSRD